MRLIASSILFLIYFNSTAQTTYISNPGLTVYTNCPGDTPNTCPSGTFLGNTIHFTLDQITSTDFVFIGKKCDGSSFGSGGTSYIKEGGVCGTIEDSDIINSGDPTTVLNVPIPPDFLSGTKTYYLTLNSDTGDKFWGGSIMITATTQDFFLQLDQPMVINPNPPITGQNVFMTAKIINNGDGGKSGQSEHPHFHFKEYAFSW